MEKMPGARSVAPGRDPTRGSNEQKRACRRLPTRTVVRDNENSPAEAITRVQLQDRGVDAVTEKQVKSVSRQELVNDVPSSEHKYLKRAGTSRKHMATAQRQNSRFNGMN